MRYCMRSRTSFNLKFIRVDRFTFFLRKKTPNNYFRIPEQRMFRLFPPKSHNFQNHK
jgi:hypothetical protein